MIEINFYNVTIPCSFRDVRKKLISLLLANYVHIKRDYVTKDGKNDNLPLRTQNSMKRDETNYWMCTTTRTEREYDEWSLSQ